MYIFVYMYMGIHIYIYIGRLTFMIIVHIKYHVTVTRMII